MNVVVAQPGEDGLGLVKRGGLIVAPPQGLLETDQVRPLVRDRGPHNRVARLPGRQVNVEIEGQHAQR